MIAHLGMYDVPDANAAFWSAIRDHLGYGPAHLTHRDDFWDIWQSPELLFSQTCGYPYRARLHGQVQLVGTPDYGLPDCPPGHYCSVFLRRRADARRTLSDFDGACFAYNEALSQSGWAAPIHHLTKAGLRPGSLLETGGHAASCAAVASGAAEFAAVDVLTWILLEKSGAPDAQEVEVFDQTPATPTLPYVTGLTQDAQALAAAVRAAIAGMSDDTRASLHISGLVDIPAETYLNVPTPPGPETFS